MYGRVVCGGLLVLDGLVSNCQIQVTLKGVLTILKT